MNSATTKVLIIGIDGLDSILLSKFEGSLPNFSKIRKGSPSIDFQSTFPPDSSTAWASIYSGLEPAKHGIVYFKDPLNKKPREIPPIIFERTFWKLAERYGKKVCALYPFLPIDPKYDQAYPTSITKRYDFIKYEPLPLYSSWDLRKVIDKVKKRTYSQSKLALDVYQDFEWDLFYVYFPDLDNIEHIFWKYQDGSHPEFKPGNPFEDVILDMYRFFDKEVIGRFLEKIDSNTSFIIVSDHGHTRRPIKIVNINEILREMGLASPKNDKRSKLTSMCKENVIKIMNRIQASRGILLAVWKLLPQQFREIYENVTLVDEESLAVLSEPGQIEGLKTYNYAGIRIRGGVPKDLYEKICRDILEKVSEIRDPQTSEKIVEWVYKREEIYSGEYLWKYPDIIFKLRDDWGVGSDIGCPIFTYSRSYKIYSGMHKLETPVFLVSLPGGNVSVKKRKAYLMDVAPTVLSIVLGKEVPYIFDGDNILDYDRGET